MTEFLQCEAGSFFTLKNIFAKTLFLLIICFLVKMPAFADFYEFEMTRELAEAESSKIDLGKLSAASAALPSGQAQHISKDAELKWKAPEKSLLKVATGPDTLAVTGKDYKLVYDFKNKKIYDINQVEKNYVQRSLFGNLAFRQAELSNRIFLHEMMEKAFKGQKAALFFDRFYSEELFSLCLADKNSGYKIAKSKKALQDIYSYNNVQVASFTPDSSALSGDKRRQFSRFLIYSTHLHPTIRLDIEKQGRLPKALSCYLENPPVAKERVSLVLKKYSGGDFVFKTDGLTETTDPKSPLVNIYARIKELGGAPPKDLKEQVIAYYKEALDKKNYLDAMLAVTEYGLQTGENLSQEMSDLKEFIKDDPECRKFIAGLQNPESEQEAVLELGSLDMVDRSKSAKSYLIDIFRANLLVNMRKNGIEEAKTSEESNPEKAFLKVLQHNPFIAGVYHDLGKLYEDSYMHTNAWDCYELARKFYPKHPFMEEVNEKEKELAEKYPQFISGDKI